MKTVFEKYLLFYSRWVQTGTLHAESKISSLSWNLEGTRLLTASTTIQLWHEKISNNENGEPTGYYLTIIFNTIE